MRLYHAEGSPHSAAVRIALAEKGLVAQERAIDLRAFEQHRPEYLAVNPAGQVPVLEDGRCGITETLHILLYLEETCPDPALGGASPQARYQVLKWGKYVETHIAPNLAILLWSRRDPDAERLMGANFVELPQERRALWQAAAAGFPEEEIEQARLAIARAADRLAADLMTTDPARPAWLAGGSFSLADIAVYPHAARFAAAGIETPAPVADWLRRMAERPSVASDARRDPIIATMGPERARWG